MILGAKKIFIFILLLLYRESATLSVETFEKQKY